MNEGRALDLKQLRYFVTIAQEGQVTRAATKSFIWLNHHSVNLQKYLKR